MPFFNSTVENPRLPLDELSLAPPSTSPPSPFLLAGPTVSSSPLSRRPIQSVCLLPDRLLALQSTVLTRFASATAPPRKATTTFAFAHPVHSITARQAVRAATSSGTVSSSGTAAITMPVAPHGLASTHQQLQQHPSAHYSPADQRLVDIQTADNGNILALSTAETLLLWGVDPAYHQQQRARYDCDTGDTSLGPLLLTRRDEQPRQSTGTLVPSAREQSGTGRGRSGHARERRHSAVAVRPDGDGSGGVGVFDVQRRDRRGRRRSQHAGEHRVR